ncbi:phBC6A51 family helix-turn-helix protein [Paenibacillus graminis]|uniref:phBC6A51 family helix-turn-helix protein n=1 Tax=Paenibacillus graminis TaxID=189425 RepID=UPI002DBD2DE1|nr:helix-turn-helix domain-containing protein [Paenibacillus graminis]MEC0167488.1 helix-turn-helix domain-containing protein [Paenibacillus graminis]
MARKSKRRGRPVTPLDARHYQAIALLADGRMSYCEIARTCGVDRRTLQRWRQRKDFDRELRKVNAKLMNEWRKASRERMRLRTAQDMTWFFDAIGTV